MKRSIIQILIVLIFIVIAIKFVPQVNDWARGNLPEEILTVIGEKPKGIFEFGSDSISDGIKKGSDMIKDLTDKVSN